MSQSSSTIKSASMPQAKIVIIKRRLNQGFGFTLRHFIAYPPESDSKEISDSQLKAMETIFIKDVHPNGPAYYANLKTGDRVLMVNNIPIAGIAYSTIVSMIKKTPSELKLLVVPKECDVLQMHYNSIAHTSQSNVVVSAAPSIKPITESGSYSEALIPTPTWKAFQKSSLDSGHTISGNVLTLTTASYDYHQSLRSDLCSASPSNQMKLGSQQQGVAAATYPSNVVLDNSSLMTRLHESIKQKEEFLKSSISNVNSMQQVQPMHHGTRAQHFLPHESVDTSPQLSVLSMTTKTSQDSVIGANQFIRTPIRMLENTYISSSGAMVNNNEYTNCSAGSLRQPLQRTIVNSNNTSAVSNTFIAPTAKNGGVILYDKNKKDMEFSGNMQNTGVTNKVFERKLLSHFNINFDPFKPLSINTNAVDDVAVLSNEVILMNEPAILFEPSKQNSLPQMRTKQQNIPGQRHKIQSNETLVPKVIMSSSTSLTTPSWNNKPKISVDKQNGDRSQLDKIISPSPIKQNLEISNCSVLLCNNNKIVSNLPKIEKQPTLLTEADNKDHHADTNNHQPVDSTSIKVDNPKTSVVPLERMTNKCNSNITDNCLSKTNSSSVIVRRFKTSESVNARKSVRRISYLRATNQENDFNCYKNNKPPTKADISNDNILANLEVEVGENIGGVCDVIAHRNSCCDHQSSVCTEEEEDSKLKNIYKLKRSSYGNELRSSDHFDMPCGLEISDNNFSHKSQTIESDTFEAEVEMKSSCINGKRLTEYRSWRPVKFEIKGDLLKINASRNVKSDSNIIELNIKNFNILDEALDKKKYVFRMLSKQSPLATLTNELSLEDPQEKINTPFEESGKALPKLYQQQPHTDIMFRIRSYTEMKKILGLLQWKNSLIHNTEDVLGRQTAEPQKKAATTSIPTVTICDENVQEQQDEQQHTIIETITSVSMSRNESEASNPISPNLKSRKSVQKSLPKPLGSPKAKNWKDLLFRRGTTNANCNSRADMSHSNGTSCNRSYGTIGVPLKMCPMSKTNQYVPMLVDVCTNIVETKGLGVVGIYRIPGNKAAISELSEQVNMQDFSWDSCSTDVRWIDVNVVSSLLKLFIRSLPDALLPSTFYENFIEADKKQGQERLTELKHLLQSLPRHSYETMKHLFRHLNQVSKNCHVNLMEPKNLAIIFGPSIIRTPNDTLDIAVKDMKYQCRIVELLLTQYDYFFENGDMPDLKKVSGNNLATASSTVLCDSTVMEQQDSNTNMLLHNISKIERLVERDNSNSLRTSRFIPQLRKRAQSKRNSDTYSGDSALSLDYTKSPCVTTTSSSSCSSTTPNTGKHLKNKERSFLNHGIRSHNRKTSLDEKDSVSCSSIIKGPRSSIDMSILLTDDESSHSRNSDSGSMSLGIITDTLNSKLSKLRSDLIERKVMPNFTKNRRHTLDQPLNLQSENIPYADESPERHFQFCTLDKANKVSKNVMLSNSSTSVPSVSAQFDNIKPAESSAFNNYKEGKYKLQYSATVPINKPLSESLPTKTVDDTDVSSTVTTLNDVKSKHFTMGNSDVQTTGLRSHSSVYNFCGSDSEGSTTSDQKDVLVVTAPTIVEKFHKKRNYRLFRSASFNCRHYSTRSGGSGSFAAACAPCTNLTKDEKTDMNLTKKRQIQNKQHRSIKRRHTVGGPHDYSADECVIVSTCNRYCKCKSPNSNAATTTTMVIKRIPLSITNINVTNNKNSNIFQHNNTGHTSSNIRNGPTTTSSTSSEGDTNTGTATMPSEHVLEVDIRIKNISRNRFQS